MHSSRMHTTCTSSCWGAWPAPPQLPPWVWAWTRSPSTSSWVWAWTRSPSTSPWVWAWTRSPSTSPLVVGLETPLGPGNPPGTPPWDQAPPWHQAPPPPWTRHPHSLWTEFLTHASENITLGSVKMDA